MVGNVRVVGMTDADGLLNRALQQHDDAKQRSNNQAIESRKVAVPDNELGALFRDFASRVSSRFPAQDFYHRDVINEEQIVRYGFLGRYSRAVRETRIATRVNQRGSPINKKNKVTIRQSIETHTSHSPSNHSRAQLKGVAVARCRDLYPPVAERLRTADG